MSDRSSLVRSHQGSGSARPSVRTEWEKAPDYTARRRARHALYREVEEILAREAILLPLFHEQAYRFARPEVEGLTVSFGIPTVAYDNLRIRG